MMKRIERVLNRLACMFRGHAWEHHPRLRACDRCRRVERWTNERGWSVRI